MGFTRFEDRDVAELGFILRNTGDGLSDVVAVDGVEQHVGDEGYVVFGYRIEKVRFDPIKDSDDLKRVHIARANGATFVDASLVGDALRRQRERIDAAKGVQPLVIREGDVPEDWELSEAELKARAQFGKGPVTCATCATCKLEIERQGRKWVGVNNGGTVCGINGGAHKPDGSK